MTMTAHPGRLHPVIAASDLRRDLSTTINRVAYAGERLVLQRHDKDAMALVSIEDLELLESVEDLIDGSDAMAAFTSGEPVHDWDAVRKELGIA